MEVVAAETKSTLYRCFCVLTHFLHNSIVLKMEKYQFLVEKFFVQGFVLHLLYLYWIGGAIFLSLILLWLEEAIVPFVLSTIGKLPILSTNDFNSSICACWLLTIVSSSSTRFCKNPLSWLCTDPLLLDTAKYEKKKIIKIFYLWNNVI